MRAHNRIDLVGQRFGALLVTAFAESRKTKGGRHKAYWLCRCDCGQNVVKRGEQLRGGGTRTCAVAGHHAWNKTTPAEIELRKAHRLEYGPWAGMHRRCSDTRDKTWRTYGSRGITVCEAWKSFATFLADMGPKPTPKHSIDRLDNAKGYEPSNCRWATPSEQRRNSRDNVYVEIAGQRLLLVDVVEKLNLNYAAVAGRLKNGWSLEQALTIPVRFKKKKALGI